MTDYQPKSGDEVIATIHATVEGDHLAVPAGHGLTELVCRLDSPIVVRIEPGPVELPTGFCARITATVDGHRGVRLGLSDPGDSLPWRVHPDDRSRADATWYAHDDLSDVVVIDPGEVES